MATRGSFKLQPGLSDLNSQEGWRAESRWAGLQEPEACLLWKHLATQEKDHFCHTHTHERVEIWVGNTDTDTDTDKQ